MSHANLSIKREGFSVLTQEAAFRKPTVVKLHLAEITLMKYVLNPTGTVKSNNFSSAITFSYPLRQRCRLY